MSNKSEFSNILSRCKMWLSWLLLEEKAKFIFPYFYSYLLSATIPMYNPIFPLYNCILLLNSELPTKIPRICNCLK